MMKINFEQIDPIDMAKEFHRIYEDEAKLSEWKTQEQCKVKFDKLPYKNKITMIRTCARLVEWMDSLNIGFIGEIEPCKESLFHGIECLESETKYAFTKDINDIRPAHQIWINKDEAEILFKTFRGAKE